MTTKYLTPEDAVTAAKKEAESCGTVEFDGQNCNDYNDDDNYCEGWDGVDNRCECGNRRVYWETYGDKEQGYTAFACAN